MMKVLLLIRFDELHFYVRNVFFLVHFDEQHIYFKHFWEHKLGLVSLQFYSHGASSDPLGINLY